MKTLTADESTVGLLCQTNGLAEVRDQSGAVLGFFVPLGMYKVRLDAEAFHRTDRVKILCGEYRTQVVLTSRQMFQSLIERIKVLKPDVTSEELAGFQEIVDRNIEYDKDYLSTI